MWSRDAVQKGANVPEPYKLKELMADKEAMEKHAAQVNDSFSLRVFVNVLTRTIVSGMGSEGHGGRCREEQGKIQVIRTSVFSRDWKQMNSYHRCHENGELNLSRLSYMTAFTLI